MSKAPRVQIMTVTPALAAEWLALGADDRKIIPSRVRRFCRIIRHGEWQLTWDAIAFDTDGQRRNGQHRLTAIVTTGVPCQLLVLWGVTIPAVDVGDQGAKRTMRQILARQGESDPSTLATSLRLMWQWQNGRSIGDRNPDASPDVSEMQAILREHPGLRAHVVIARKLRKEAKLGSDGLGVVLSYLFMRVDPDEAEDFIARLISGRSNLDDDRDPILQVRRRLARIDSQSIGTKGGDVTYKAALIIKAFNAWRRGDLRELRWNRGGRTPEPFPTIEAPANPPTDPSFELPKDMRETRAE